MRFKCCIFLFVWVMLAFIPSVILAQDSTHVITVRDIAPKGNFIGKLGVKGSIAPYYSSEMGPGVSFALAARKGISLVGSVSAGGYALLGIMGTHQVRDTEWKISYDALYSYLPTYFWGCGYDAASYDANKTEYDRQRLSLEGKALYSVSRYLSVGPAIGFKRIKWYNFPTTGNIESNAFCYGAVAYYDARNSSVNATDGLYAVLGQTNYTDFSGKPYFSTDILFDIYRSVWDGGTLAFDFSAEFTYGDVPYTMLPTVGGPYRMRGYYSGRYRDNNAVSGQLELRQHIWKMFGAAVWAGAANLWGKYNNFDIRHSLPNSGIGVRFDLNGNMRLRLDYGFGKDGQNAFVFSINEAF